MRYQGRITSWKDDRGFGFITPNGGGNKVFVHVKSFRNRQRRPKEKEIVTYDLKTDACGRAQAESVAFVGELTPTATSGRRNTPVILAAAFLILVGAAAFAGKLPFAVLGLYLVASVVTFIAYALDKSAARNDQRRTPESTLHLFSVAGGWPGALAAQGLLRHKSRKQSFQFVFWITALLNCGALAWLLSPSGAAALRLMVV